MSSFLNDVNPKQLEAIKTTEGPMMVVAGPGSGKTRVLTYRIAYLISIGVPAYQILALTFTNKAAREMMDRIVALVGSKSKQLWMGTFHSIFARLLRVECEKIGFQSTFSIYDELDSVALVKTVMNNLGISTQQFNPYAIRARISGAKNQLVLPEEYTRLAVDIFEEKTGRVFTEYQRRLKLNNAMDFDDLLLRPIELFTRHKKVLEKYQDRFRFILIDEYQDTNHAQYMLIKLIADKYRNLSVVGDDAQSIYAFRGADIRNILDFERDYPDAKIIRLEQNYRSTKNILAAADQVIKKNVDQIVKNLWTENLDGEKITVLACEDDRDEGSSIVNAIFEEKRRSNLQFRDFAIMYRTNAQSRTLEDALRRNSIPYTIIGGIEFYQRKEVKDVLAYLRMLVNPHDDESFIRIANYPNRGIGDASVQRLKSFAGSRSMHLLEAARQSASIAGLPTKAKEGLSEVAEMFRKYNRIKEGMSISELSRSLVDEIGILPIFKEEGTPEAMARWENVQELLSAISEFTAQRENATLEMFLQEVSLVSDVDRWNDTFNAVTLMTLHSAKGLEFPVVFVSGLEEGLLPFYNGSLDRKELEEERRLFYVGVTRAMKKLYLSHSRTRFRYAELTYQSPSRFLEEFDKELMEVIGTASRYVQSGHALTSARWLTSDKKNRRRQKQASERSHFDDVFPDYENDASENLRVGGMVEHETFGRGKVLHISGTGDAMKAVVDFPSVGKKNLMLKYARLKVL